MDSKELRNQGIGEVFVDSEDEFGIESSDPEVAAKASKHLQMFKKAGEYHQNQEKPLEREKQEYNRWSEAEEHLFFQALKLYKKDWERVCDHIKTKTKL